jgi:hypothetical protein
MTATTYTQSAKLLLHKDTLAQAMMKLGVSINTG